MHCIYTNKFIFLVREKKDMDLITKVGIIVIVLALFIVLASFLQHGTASQLTESQAVTLVMKKLNLTYPNAVIQIINVSNSSYYSNSKIVPNWDITVSIIENATLACPGVSTESFSYPARGLLPITINNYTNTNCTMSGLGSAPLYIINSPYVAKMQSYISKYPQIISYVKKYGYANTLVSAKLMAVIGPKNFTNINRTFYNSWLVSYNANNANTIIYVLMNTTGTILYNFSVPK
ncbi:MAG: hypothetical protein ACP5TL_02295 [Candidatus Micrarchaeia archaeon]